MNEKLKLSVLIISFNTKAILSECLNSIYKAKLKYPFEIIVVDNTSHDSSAQMVKNEYPLIKLIENKENLLFAKANNQAAAVACGEYLLLLNSDTLIKEGNIEKLIEFLDRSGARIACAGPCVLNSDTSHQSSGFALPSVFERTTMVFKLNRLLPQAIARLILPEGTPGLYNDNHKVGWVAGCCILIRKGIYQQVGGLNEKLGFYGEEVELGWKLKALGYETWVVGDASIIHLGGCSTKNDYAAFLEDLDGKLYRYSQLQKYTIGYRKAIRMSQIVIIAAQIKQIMARDPQIKKYFKHAIEYEKKVVAYLKHALKNEINVSLLNSST